MSLPPDAFAFLGQYHVGDFAGLIGLTVSIVGLTFTYLEARKSAKAAEAARVAAEQARTGRRLVDVSVALAGVAEKLAEFKSVIRTDDWSTLSSRIDSLCWLIATTRADMLDGSSPGFTSADVSVLEAAKQKLRDLEPSLTGRSAKPPQSNRASDALQMTVLRPLTEMLDAIVEFQHRAKLLSSRK